MIRRIVLITLSVFLIFQACRRSDHFISDREYRDLVLKQFEVQKEMAGNRSQELFGVFNGDLSTGEEEALTFLYAFMPLSDLADYDGEFFLSNVRVSLAARDTFHWGKSIPEEIFRHFVLPVRVNNENMDSSRVVFFRELKERVSGLSMKDAVLEVNHWCHEKVTYKATDGRTSSPLATVKTAFGRCGEESTFTVAALRSVGIPARQCYTPRWAHSDDNHAWVEVWVDGKWHFIGACEPEPDLDLAWFTVPATRAMLVSTNVFGVYQGPEDKLLSDPRFTRINVLSNYAPVKRITVKVTDAFGNPADSATVEFRLYNYAEFYPIHQTFTDRNGCCSFETGYGDLLVWSARKGLYGYGKVTVSLTDTFGLKLSLKPGYEYQESYDFVPPPPGESSTTVSDSLKQTNARRLAFEDEIRRAYESTFIDSAMSYRLAGTLQMHPDTLWRFLRLSRGNWRELVGFISGATDPLRPWVFPLLTVLSEKDLRDADPAALKDHLDHFLTFPPLETDRGLVARYILNPRISLEGLRPWRAVIQKRFDTGMAMNFRNDPATVMQWIKDNIRTDATANYGRAPISPAGSLSLRVTDPRSENILFVAICRSFGIPARLESATAIPQYHAKGKWNDAAGHGTEPTLEEGTITLLNDPSNPVTPVYYTHFTLENYRDGFFQSLDYESDPVFRSYPATVSVDPGYYLLVTGNRKPDGTVMTELNYFTVDPGKHITRSLKLRTDPAPDAILGKVDMKNLFMDLDMGKTVEINGKKPVILAWLEPDREPTKHFVSDLRVKRIEFNHSDVNLLLLFKNDAEKHSFRTQYEKELPVQTRYITTNPASIGDLRQAVEGFTGRSFPVVVLLTPAGDICYLSEGYRIGTGGELLKLLDRMNKKK